MSFIYLFDHVCFWLTICIMVRLHAWTLYTVSGCEIVSDMPVQSGPIAQRSRKVSVSSKWTECRNCFSEKMKDNIYHSVYGFTLCGLADSSVAKSDIMYYGFQSWSIGNNFQWDLDKNEMTRFQWSWFDTIVRNLGGHWVKWCRPGDPFTNMV